MSGGLLPFKDLTPEQHLAVEIGPDHNRLVFGEPGSGKTQVLLHRAAYLRKIYSIKPEKFIIFVYTNVLKKYIQSSLELLDLPQDSCTTWEAWCYRFYQQHVGGRVPYLKEERVPDFKKIHREILNLIKEGRVKTPLFDIVMVDEGQDLDIYSYEILKRIASHVTVCVDHKQQIFEQGSNEREIVKRLGIESKNITLLQGYRCNPFVVNLAAEFIPNNKEKTQFINQGKALKAEKAVPLLYLAEDFEDEKRRLIELVKLRQGKDDQVAVIFPQKKMVFGFTQGFQETGLCVEDIKNLNFNSNLPKMLTYQSAKGLTFDTVFLPRLVPWAFRKVEEERLAKLLFVAVTRAKKWVYLSTYKGKELELINKLKPLEAKGMLTIQDRGIFVNDSDDDTLSPRVGGWTSEEPNDNVIDLF